MNKKFDTLEEANLHEEESMQINWWLYLFAYNSVYLV